MYLNAEFKEVNIIFEQCKKEFLIEVSKSKKQPMNVSLTQAAKHLEEGLDDALKIKENNSDSYGLKKLYRKIMLKAHPDKLILLKDDATKELYSDICSKTMRAMEDKSWYLLFEAATELGIKDIEINNSHIEMLEDDCKKLESKISKIKRTVPWMWFHFDDKIKEKCLKQYLKM
jgi:hypothetical protein